MGITINKDSSVGDISSAFLIYIFSMAGLGIFVTYFMEFNFHIIAFQLFVFCSSFIFRKYFKTKKNKNINELLMFFISGSLAAYIVVFINPGHSIILFLPERLLMGLGSSVFILFIVSLSSRIKNGFYVLISILCAFALLRILRIQEWTAANDIWILILFGAPLLKLVDILFPITFAPKGKSS